MNNKPVKLNDTEFIIAVQSLYFKKVSYSIEVCSELVQEFMKSGICRRGYRRLCNISKSTVYEELLKLVPYQDRKFYENNKTLIGIDKLDIKIHVLKIYQNHKLDSVIDISNNKVLYDINNTTDDTIIFNQLMTNINLIMYKSTSSLLNQLESEENRKFFRGKTWQIYDGMCSSLVSMNILDEYNISEVHAYKYSNVSIHINVNLLQDIYYNLISSADNSEPVLLATNTHDDELFIVRNIVDNNPRCEMYISLGDGTVTKSVVIDSNTDIYIVFNAMITVMNASVEYNAKVEIK